MTAMPIYISLDAGGTQAKGVAITLPDGRWQAFSLPCKNFRSITDLELANLFLGVINRIGPTLETQTSATRKFIWLIGAAGLRPEHDHKRVAQILPDIGLPPAHIELYPDFEANHAAALGTEHGVLSVNGTGSVLFAVGENGRLRRQGWGYLLDELPSAAAFGRWALQGVLGSIEGMHDEPQLVAFLEQVLPIFTGAREQIIDYLYLSSAAQSLLGRFGPVLTQAYEHGSPFARRHIEHSINLWKTSMEAIARDLCRSTEVPYSCVGGLWEHWPTFTALTDAALTSSTKFTFRRQPARCQPWWGPLLRYFQDRVQPTVVTQILEIARHSAWDTRLPDCLATRPPAKEK